MGFIMDLLIDRFLNYIRIEKGLADNSINAYARDIRVFAEYLEKKDILFEAASRGEIIGFMSEMRDRGLSPRSINRALSKLKGTVPFSFIHYCKPKNNWLLD